MTLLQRYVGRLLALLTLLAATALISLLAYSEVDNRLTAEDVRDIDVALGPALALSKPEQLNLTAQIDLIRQVVSRVFAAAPSLHAIPEGRPREPGDVMRNGGGVCYDRSRFIEKALRSQGFETRHVALYRRLPHQAALTVLATRDTVSHAVTEVKTRAGWLLVDPVNQWLSVDARGQPVGAMQIARSHRGGPPIDWPAKAAAPEFYTQNFLLVYGLYSRHGSFFPPFNAIPDVNYSELLDNFVPQG
ncbi:MAG: hypothetical protein RI907_3519 [Pseudomonadota bacterium]